MEKEFCGQCGSQIFTRPELIEGMVYLNLGNFDDWEAFKPKVEIWTDYKSSWLGKFDCVAETFVDNGTLERIQMFIEKTLTNENEPSLPFPSTKFSWLHHYERNLRDAPRP